MPSDQRFRTATAEDHSAVTETVALAFGHDPVWSWVLPDPARRLAQLRAVWGLIAESAIAGGWVRCADDCSAAAIWIAPGRPELEQRLQPLRDGATGRVPGADRRRAGPGLPRVLEPGQRTALRTARLSPLRDLRARRRRSRCDPDVA